MASMVKGMAEMNDTAKTLESALAYLGHGWSVIPVEGGGKLPLVRWEEYQHRRAEEKELRQWLRHWPDANIAIVTGKISGLVVIDIDPRHQGDDSLYDLERRYGALPETIEALTGGGGRHLYFQHPGAPLCNRAALVPGIDLRGDGGVVVAPPSLHPSGRRYAWKVSHHPNEVAPAPMPDWLLGFARGTGEHPGHPLSHWRTLVSEGVPEGQRNTTIASLTGHLLWHGVDAEVVLEMMLCWNRVRCRPPLSDEEVARTVESIGRTHARHGGGGED